MIPVRNGLRVGLASLLLLAGARSVHDASATGDSRTLSFHHTHSGEDLTVTFKRSGRYDDEALKTLNHFLRDWRSQEQTTMNPQLFDIIWEVYRDVDGKKPIQIISAFRSPATNAMLRRRSSGVARSSQHMLGHAMDFFIPEIPLEQIRFAGLRLQRGGVGFYPTSGSPFVHLDTGNIRHWPRMNHDQLARVFPDGRTVHVPSDGAPLAGYQLALADIEKRGDGDVAPLKGKTGFLASLFNKKPANEDDEESTSDSVKPAPLAVTASITASKVIDKVAALVPLPRPKPDRAASYQVASASTQDVIVAPPVVTKTGNAPQTPADIINARGFWSEPASPPPQVEAIKSQPPVAPNVSQAMAYVPPNALLDRSKVVATSAPVPLRLAKLASPAADPMALGTLPVSAIAPDAIATKSGAGAPSAVATVTRVAALDPANDMWMRAMILTPSATTSLSTTVLGDQNMAAMRSHFAKPDIAIAMAFSDDPQMGLLCDRFTGAAIATLSTMSFRMRTASLR